MSLLADARTDIASAVSAALPTVQVTARTPDKRAPLTTVTVYGNELTYDSLGTVLTATIDGRVPYVRPSLADAEITDLSSTLLSAIRQVDTARCLWIGDPYEVSVTLTHEEEVDGTVWAVATAEATYLVGDLTAEHQPATPDSPRARVEAWLTEGGITVATTLAQQNKHPAVTVRDDSLVAGDPRRGTLAVTVAVAPGADPIPVGAPVYQRLHASTLALPTGGILQSGSAPRGAVAAGEILVLSCDLLEAA